MEHKIYVYFINKILMQINMKFNVMSNLNNKI